MAEITSEEDAIDNPFKEYCCAWCITHNTCNLFPINMQRTRDVPRAWDPSSTISQTISRHWTIGCMASLYCDKGKKRFKGLLKLKCNATKWFVKLQEKHSLKKYTHIQKRRTQGKVGLPTYDNQLGKINLLGRQQCPHGCCNFAMATPSLMDKIGEGTMNTKPTTFFLSPISTTLSSIAYLLNLFRHCANSPFVIAILSSYLPMGYYSLYNFRHPKNIVHYHRRR